MGGIRERRVTVSVMQLDSSGERMVELVVRDSIGDLVTVILSRTSAEGLLHNIETAVIWAKEGKSK